MKLRIELDDNLQEEEIIIRCRELSPQIIQLKETISESLQKNEIISAQIILRLLSKHWML